MLSTVTYLQNATVLPGALKMHASEYAGHEKARPPRIGKQQTFEVWYRQQTRKATTDCRTS